MDGSEGLGLGRGTKPLRQPAEKKGNAAKANQSPARTERPTEQQASQAQRLSRDQHSPQGVAGKDAKDVSGSAKPTTAHDPAAVQSLVVATHFPVVRGLASTIPVHQFMQHSVHQARELSMVFVEALSSAKQVELDELMRDYGASNTEWKTFLSDTNSVYAKSASADQQLLHPNDHDGILIVPAPDGDTTIAERFVVITDFVDGRKRYFVKGEGERIIPFSKLSAAMSELDSSDGAGQSTINLDRWLSGDDNDQGLVDRTDLPQVRDSVDESSSQDDNSHRARRYRTNESPNDSRLTSTEDETEVSHADSSIDETPRPARKPEELELETALRTKVHELSVQSELCARRDPRQSDTKLLPKPPNAMPLRSERTWWSNQEPALCGFGGKDTQGFHRFYFDFSAIENRLIIFKCSKFKSDKPADRPRDGAGVKININVGGPVLAIINGIKPQAEHGLEVIGGPPKQSGVKLGTVHDASHKLQNLLQKLLQQGVDDPNHPRVMRITTSDDAVHELTLTTTGCHLKLVNPKRWQQGGAAFGQNIAPVGDVDLYTYYGIDTLMRGSADGFPDPMLESSFGDLLLAGPLMFDRRGVPGYVRPVLTSLGRIATLDPQIARARGYVGQLLTFVIANGLTIGVNAAFASSWASGFSPGPTNATNANDGYDTTGDFNITGTFNATGTPSYGTEGIGLQGVTNYIAGVVGFHLLLTRAIAVVTAALPPEVRDKFDRNMVSKFAGSMIGSVRQFARLMVNFGWGAATKVRSGGWEDACTMFSYSLADGVRDFLAARSGADHNHPSVVAAHTTLKALEDTVFRSLGNVLSNAASSGDRSAHIVAAVTARLYGRWYDKLAAPLMAIAANSAGLWGNNADAYDHQLSRETGGALNIEYWTDRLAKVSQDLIDDLTDVESALWIEDVQSRAAQFRDTFLMQKIDGIPKEIDHAEKSGGYAHLSSAAEREECLASMHERFTRWSLHEPIDNPVSGLPAILLNYTQELLREAAGEYPVEQMLDGRPKPINARPGWTQDTRKVKRKYGTFSREAQALAKPVHDTMVGRKSMGDDVPNNYPFLWRKEARPLTNRAVVEIRLAARHYSEESGLFHYTGRYENTGQPRWVPIAEGISFVHRAMTRSDNSRQIHPSETLCLNLGAHYAVTFPGVFYRAAVTEAAYQKRGSKAPTTVAAHRVVREGDFVGLTEVFSGTTCKGLANAWGNALALSRVPSDRSQLIAMHVETATNIAKFTENVQGEIIVQPGTLMRVTSVWPVKDGEGVKYVPEVPKDAQGVTSAKPAARVATPSDGNPDVVLVISDDELSPTEKSSSTAKSSSPSNVELDSTIDDSMAAQHAAEAEKKRQISETIYFQQVNTYDLECVFHRLELALATGSGWEPENGELMIDPRSGHFYAYSRAEQGVAFVSHSKNYYMGWDLEKADKKNGALPANKLARWMHPYTSDEAPRGMKDGIHAAILEGKEISKYLDVATSNFSHAYFRHKGGFADSPAGKAELAEKTAVRQQAQKVFDQHIGSLTLDTALSPTSTPQLAWLLNSMLRQPIQLIPTSEKNGWKADLAHVTYDGVNSAAGLDVLQRQPILIGCGKTFSSVHSSDGNLHPAHEAPLTVRGFLDVFLRAAADPGSSPAQGKTEAAAAQLLTKLKAFAKTEYLVLQRELVRKYDPDWAFATRDEPHPPANPMGAGLATETVLAKCKWDAHAARSDAKDGESQGKAFLKDNKIERVPNPGASREHSFLFALVQHRKMAYDNGHFTAVDDLWTKTRMEMKKAAKKDDPGGKVDSEDRTTLLQTAVREFNKFYRTKHDVVVTTVNLHGVSVLYVIPHSGGRLVSDKSKVKMASAITVIWRAEKGQDRYEALTMRDPLAPGISSSDELSRAKPRRGRPRDWAFGAKSDSQSSAETTDVEQRVERTESDPQPLKPSQSKPRTPSRFRVDDGNDSDNSRPDGAESDSNSDD